MPTSGALHGAQLVTELLLFRFQVAARGVRRRYLQGNGFGDRKAVSFKADELAVVVREQAHGPDTQIAKDLRSNAVIALVGLEPQPFVGLDGVVSLVLQFVRADLVGETDS